MAKLYKDIFIDIIKEQINAGQFKTKQDLIKFLNDFNTQYFNNPTLIQKLKQAGINLKELDVNKAAQELLEYYDRGKTDTSSLNLDGISQVAIGDKDYIKVEKADGSVKLFDDSMNNDGFVKQFQDRQNASYNYQTKDGVKNREQIINDMGSDKINVNLTASYKAASDLDTAKEKKEFSAVMGMADAKETNFLVNTDENIYVNTDNGDMYYTNRNSEGDLEVKKAGETTQETVGNNINQSDTMDNDEVITVAKGTIDFNSLNNLELQYIKDNRMNTLTPEQQAIVNNLLERRTERLDNPSNNMEKGHQKVLTNTNNKIFTEPYDGFTSVMYLSLVTLISGIVAILYLVLKIYL